MTRWSSPWPWPVRSKAVEKQALLEAPTDADRAATLLALLQMGAAGPDLPPGHSVS